MSSRTAGTTGWKTALITGGDSGIGRAVALAFAREGADVAISNLPEEETDAREFARWARDAGREPILLPGEITDERHCRAIVERVMSERGRIDILVNNAAYQMTHQRIEEWSSEEFEHTFRANVFAMFCLAKACLPRMGPGSAIVNTASVQAYQPSGMLLAYAATKRAIVAFTKALAELAIEKGVRVNAVAPGPVWTPLIPSTMPREKVEKFGRDNPMKPPAQPAEMAPAYVYLASNDSSFVMGSVMDLTGREMLP